MLSGKTHHLCETSSRHDVTCMHESVEVSGTLLNLLTHVVVDLHVKDIGHQIKRVLVVLNFRVEASEVETIGQVVFVDLAIVLIAAR